MIDPKLKSKVTLLTGANHGMGAAAARAFAKQGAKIFLAYYRDACTYSNEQLEQAKKQGNGGDVLYRAMHEQTADEIVKKIKADSGEAAAMEVDLSDADNISKLFGTCEKELGPVDILINNHTYCVAETFDPSLTTDKKDRIKLISKDGIDKHFAVNTRAYALLMSEYLLRYLKRKASWGRIINISTDAAHAHTANVSYAASKHAIESYSRSAAAEMGTYGITVNIIAPGPTQTGWITPELEKELSARTPLQRIGQPDDIADVVVFLASEQARWITGQLIYVGGGFRMHQ